MKIFSILFLVFLLTSCIPEESKTITQIRDYGKIEVFFCPQENCEKELVNFLDSAQESIDCALFDIGLTSVKEKLLEKKNEARVRVVTDNDYTHKFNHSFVREDSYKLMHNKFCIVDRKKVSTGSMNPTENGAHKNNNNLILMESNTIAETYEAEFVELWQGEFKGGERNEEKKIIFNDGSIVQIYFCPEDNCAYHVKEELKKAKESIYFMTFSFTHTGIANVLLLKQIDGINVSGVMEARQVTKFSEFERLKFNGVDVIKDSNKQNMHHKVFIIDEKVVVTGSFNPTNNGNKGNDENLVVIENEKIAKEFVDEFRKLTK